LFVGLLLAVLLFQEIRVRRIQQQRVWETLLVLHEDGVQLANEQGAVEVPPLPPDENDPRSWWHAPTVVPRVTHVDLVNAYRTRLAHLARLPSLTRIDGLNVFDVPEYGTCPQLPTVREITLRGDFQRERFELLAQSVPNLTTLDISFCRAFDDDLSAFRALPHLKSLNLRGCHISGPGLSQVPHLVTLGLSEVSMNHNLVASCARDLPELRELDLSYSTLDDQQLGRLCKLPKLEKLNLSDTNVTSAGLRALVSLPNLRELKLSWCAHIDDEAIASLSACSALTVLHIDRSSLSPAALKRLPARITCLD